MADDVEHIKLAQQINACYNIYKKFFWLIDSYVLDFFTDDHWKKLPLAWKNFLNNILPSNLANVLELHSKLKIDKVAPLSLLALRVFLHEYSFPRRNFNYSSNINLNRQNLFDLKSKLFFYGDLHKESKIVKLFWRHVKPKKRHEINIMAEETFEKVIETNCRYVIDIGSGLGHLVRMLAYGYDLHVCGIEVQEQLTKIAMQLDEKFEIAAMKYYKDTNIFKKRPVHVNLKIEPDQSAHDFEELIKNAFGIMDTDFNFGIVGLHPCGDLGSTLLRLFNDCTHCKFINIVGCCYMKLTTEKFVHIFYKLYCLLIKFDKIRGDNFQLMNEMSQFIIVLFQESDMWFSDKEIACHHLEMYIERLKTGYHWELKIHAYRAIIEKLISKNWPNMVHSSLANVKYTKDLTFSNYCEKALKKYDITIDNSQINSPEVVVYLKEWANVVIYYTLRLQMAPLLETIILLDRLLYIQENGRMFHIKSAFDPKISPRNFIVNATKL